jgi:hypothetical protein
MRHSVVPSKYLNELDVSQNIDFNIIGNGLQSNIEQK